MFDNGDTRTRQRHRFGADARRHVGKFDAIAPCGNAELALVLHQRLTVVIDGDRDIALASTPTAPVNIGGQTYSPAQIGTLGGSIKLQDVAPFIGIGWDDTFYRSGRWGIRAIAGVAWSDAPEVALTSTGGSLSNDPTFQARLRDESRTITDDVEGYGLFPIVQVGLNYKF